MTVKKIIHANNIDYLRTLKDNSVDSVVTDPPYGISFMGKKWDYDVPSVETWQEVYRVLKPGGHMLVACGTRTQHRMAVNIEDAGFEIRDIVAWVYGSGFPKSMDVSKALDKHLGAEREVVGSKHVKDFSNHKGSMMSKTTTEKYETHGTDVDITAPSTDQAKQWQGWGTALKPAMELWTLARKPLNGTVAQNILEYGVGGINIDATRIPFGDETDSRVGTKTKRGDSKRYKYSQDDLEIIKELDDDLDFVWTEKTEQFKDLDEFYDFLDDYHFYKPRENTILDFDIFDYEVVILHSEKKKVVPLIETFKNKLNSNSMFGVSDKGVQMYKNNGRFPANFIHDGSDEVENSFPLENEESPSRFFYVAKASQEERNFGLSFMESKTTTDGRKKPIDNAFNRGETKRKNIHPTVKPIELMRYLVRMITPPNGICLDPYLGSGTTAIACEMEKFNYIGIELDEQYVEIAKARVGAVKDYETSLDTKTAIKESIKEDKEKELGIQNIFDFMEEKENE